MIRPRRREQPRQALFDQDPQVRRSASRNDLVYSLAFKVVGEAPKLATCKVVLTHEDLVDHRRLPAGVVNHHRTPNSFAPAAGNGRLKW